MSTSKTLPRTSANVNRTVQATADEPGTVHAASPVITHALAYLKNRWSVIPVKGRAKNPVSNDWPELRISVNQLPGYFPNGTNIGLLTGEPSGGLVDVDLDAPEALEIAPVFLPKTGMVHGRPSKPKSHYWFVSSPTAKPEKFTDTDSDETCLLEIRSTRQQTVAPPSFHESGEAIAWDCPLDRLSPAVFDRETLRRSVATVAAVALCARHWPGMGTRHEAALALSGLLLQGGLTPELTRHFVFEAAKAAKDGEAKQRLRDVESTITRMQSAQPLTGKSRLSDLLGKEVVRKIIAWMELTQGPVHDTPAGPYRIINSQICVEHVGRFGTNVVPLCNFAARVAEEIALDDGAETIRAFLIEGETQNGDTVEKLPAIRVPAARFGNMSWVTEGWGLRAIVKAGSSVKDKLREGIQRLSPEARQRKLFQHTGWRELQGRWVYLTASGAVGQDGIDVDLPERLARYDLPSTPANLVEAVRASLDLLKVASPRIMAPLWSAVYRAPLIHFRPVDFSLWLEGFTGSLKSTLSALALCHWGDFDKNNLPGSWTSTANALERQAFLMKDVLFPIDDFVPTATDSREMEAKASHVLRSQGNLSSRSRLRVDLTERPGYAPRGLIVVTGEQHPQGQSAIARTALIEVSRDKIRLDLLTAAQRKAALLPNAMAGYIAWITEKIPTLRQELKSRFESARGRLEASDSEHLRVPEMVANLWLGVEYGLQFAEDVAACSAAEAEDLKGICWNALQALGETQQRVVLTEQPSHRFLNVLWSLIAQHKVTLLPRSDSGENLRADQVLIGWEDDERLYLLPEAAFHAVFKSLREAGEAFPVRQNRLLKDLAHEGVADSDAGHSTRPVSIAGRIRRVLCLRKMAVEAVVEGH